MVMRTLVGRSIPQCPVCDEGNVGSENVNRRQTLWSVLDPLILPQLPAEGKPSSLWSSAACLLMKESNRMRFHLAGESHCM